MIKMPPQGLINQNYLNQYGNRFVRSLGTRLATGKQPASILAQGDSTGDATTDWVYKTIEWLMKKYPAYTFLYRLWDDTDQCYGNPTIMQTGTAGEAYADLPGASGDYVSTPDAAAVEIAGDIEVIIKCAADDWDAAAVTLVSKFGSAGNYSWAFSLLGSGKPYFWWSADGTNLIQKDATAIPAYVDGTAIWLKATLDVDNGAGGYDVKFYTSSNGTTWTQLGTTVTTAGATSIFNGTAPIEIGTRSGGVAERFNGKVYRAIVKDGIDGEIVCSPDFSMAHPSLVTTFTDGEGNTWTINGNVTVGNGAPGFLVMNASKSGGTVSYSTNATRFAKQAAYEPQLAFINYSHNETNNITTFITDYEGLATDLITKWANVGVVFVTQNPQKAPEVNIVPHAIRNTQIARSAAVKDYGLVDVFRALMETGDPDSYNDDGAHPTAAGYALWANEVIKFLQPAVL